MVLNNGNIKILSFYIGFDNQCVKVYMFYLLMTLDQKSSGSSPDWKSIWPWA